MYIVIVVYSLVIFKVIVCCNPQMQVDKQPNETNSKTAERVTPDLVAATSPWQTHMMAQNVAIATPPHKGSETHVT